MSDDMQSKLSRAEAEWQAHLDNTPQSNDAKAWQEWIKTAVRLNNNRGNLAIAIVRYSVLDKWKHA